ncbi:MAG TPA: transposase [Actinomycetota bacterium]|nr:transposase [Actinomycetota bacterium]
MTTLADDLVPDELWALIEPLLPAPPRPPYGGRHRAIPDRNCFAAIICAPRRGLMPSGAGQLSSGGGQYVAQMP